MSPGRCTAQRTAAGEVGQDGDGLGHVCALGVLADQLVGLPPQTVAGDLVAEFGEGRGRFRVALHGTGDGEDRQGKPSILEDSEYPPQSGA